MSPTPLTPRSQKAIREAAEFAKECVHAYVGTEHLLVGLLRLNDGIAFNFLSAAGIKEEAFRAWLIEQGHCTPPSELDQLKTRVKNLEIVVRNMVAPTNPSTEGNPS